MNLCVTHFIFLSIPQYGTMPWLAIPMEEGSAKIKNELAQTLGIQGIPTVVVLDAKTGEFITAEARNKIEEIGGDDPLKASLAIQGWKNLPRRSLAEAKLSMPGMDQNPIMKIIMFFARNPIYVFALMYFYKYLTKQMKIWYPEAYPDEAGDADEAVPETGAGDSEF